MKKLLSIFGALTIVGGAGVSVVACSNGSDLSGPSTAAKIKDTNISLPALTNRDTSNPATIIALKKALKQANPQLTQKDENGFSFQKVWLDDNEQSNSVLITIRFKNGFDSFELSVFIHSTAAQIKAKITNPNTTIAIPAGSKLSNATTQTALRKAIHAKYYLLSDYDTSSSTITFPDAATQSLTDNETANTVKLKITDDAAKPSSVEVDLTKVEIHATAAQIAAKINKSALIAISSLSYPPLSNEEEAIKTSMQKVFTTLSDYDMTTITFANPSQILKDDQYANTVVITITDDSANGTKINVSLTDVEVNSTAEEIAAKFWGKENNLISLKADSNDKLSNQTTADQLRASIKSEFGLTDYDMAHIAFANKSQILTDNETANSVTLKIKDDEPIPDKDTVTLTNVQIHSTAYEIRAKLNNVGRLSATIVNPDPSDDTLSQTNINKILSIVKANNPQLSIFDQSTLSIDVNPSTILTADTRVAVTLKIKADSKKPWTATITLNVARFETSTSDKYKAFKIADKIGASLLVAIKAGSNPDVTNPVTNAEIKNTIQKLNPTITNADKAKIYLPNSQTLKTEEYSNTVVITIKESTGNTEKVTLPYVQIHRTAAQIASRVNAITKKMLIINGSGGTTGSGDIDKRIQNALQSEFFGYNKITNWDITQIIIPAGKDVTVFGVPINFICEDDNQGIVKSASIDVRSTS